MNDKESTHPSLQAAEEQSSCDQSESVLKHKFMPEKDSKLSGLEVFEIRLDKQTTWYSKQTNIQNGMAMNNRSVESLGKKLRTNMFKPISVKNEISGASQTILGQEKVVPHALFQTKN